MRRIMNWRIFAALWMGGTLGAVAAENRAGAEGASARLPVSEIVLYSSGVGYFHREGEVDGQSKLELRFKVEDINDLLKSMVVQDFGKGTISAVSYASRDPLEKALKSFGLDLTDNPTFGQLLNQLRGEPVEFMRPGPMRGTILGVERKLQPADGDKQMEAEFLNLVTEDGLQSIPMNQIQRLKLLNERLNSELNQALALLANSHDSQKKTVAIQFDGAGRRKVSVGYIAQTPVWKTSYRLVLDKEKPFMQGWAIVENTTDEDWRDVRMSLVSGRPISFIMDLYEPLYTSRPVVQHELYSSLRPPIHQDAMEKQEEALAAKSAAAPNTLSRLGAGFGGGGRVLAAPALAESAVRQDRELHRLQLADSVVPAAEGARIGELFEYSIKTPVSIARQQSAMLPIINQTVSGEKVSIYNPNVQAKHPLNGFRLKNNTPLHLMQGPITVYEEGSYAGDSRIEDLAPGQERLLSYALDLKTEVELRAQGIPQDLVQVALRKGTLIATRKARDERTYVVRNRDQKNKTVLIEHPVKADWKLVEPQEPAERTRDVYRFAVATEPEKTSQLTVREERQYSEQVQISNLDNNAVLFYVRSPKVGQKVKAALQKVVTLRDRLDQIAAARSQREQRVREITDEQMRIRENMAKLSPNSELYSRYVKKLDEQETDLEKLREQIETLKNDEIKQRAELTTYIANLELE